MTSKSKIKFSNLIRGGSFQDRIKSLLKLEKDPKKVARSVAVGTFFGLLLPMGFQTIVAIPLGVVLNCNVVIVGVATLITNPVTVLPIYAAAVYLGEIVTGISVNWEAFRYFPSDRTLDTFLSLGSEISSVLLIGLLMLGIVFSGLLYLVSYYIILISLSTNLIYQKEKSHSNV
jgi:uncharacterized protein (DUF2062 family)